MTFHNYSVVERYPGNPILTGKDFPDAYHIIHVFNSGIVKYNGKYLMVCRCEDAGLKAYFWIAESDDGLSFTPRDTPIPMPEDDPMYQKYAEINIYDPRVTKLGDTYYLMHAAHSRYDCRGVLQSTKDFETFTWHGFITDAGNRNLVLFPEKFPNPSGGGDDYVRLDRPLTTWDSGDMWISYSKDLIHWGRGDCILPKSRVPWAWSKVGAGAVPIKTDKGWLNIFHGVRSQAKAHLIYQLGVCVHDLDDPSKIIALSRKPILTPTMDYELHGQTPSVVFTAGAVPEDDGSIKLYYGGADTVQCVGFTTVDRLLAVCDEP
ncbi:MAG: glycoside hydrolase family 130 protein [Planctomycetota bacterium]